jgi:hypothetical protein
VKGLSLDFHRWRGVFLWPKRDLFHFRITFAFVTLWVCRFCVHERVIQLARMAGLDEAKKFDLPRDKSEREGTK